VAGVRPVSLDFTAGTNRVITSPAFTAGALVSVGVWMYATGMGSSNAGCVLFRGPTTDSRAQARWNGVAGSNKFEFISGRTTTNGIWAMTTGFAVLARWRWLGLTYDNSSLSNHPTLYFLDQGVWSVLTNGAGLTRTQAPVGALLSDATELRMGNNAALSFQWRGFLAHLCVYGRILTEAEMRLLAERGPRRLPRGLLFSWPGVRLDGGTTLKDELGSRDGVASGTGIASAPTEHPPARW